MTVPSGSSTWRSIIARRMRQCRPRSEEHTSELQSLRHLVCRLLLVENEGLEVDGCECGIPLRDRPALGLRSPLECFFFFNGWGAPGVFPFSPPRPFPD